MLSRRLKSQITQLMDLIQQPLSLQTYHEDDIKLTKDYFGLHKLIIAVTETGKVSGSYLVYTLATH